MLSLKSLTFVFALIVISLAIYIPLAGSVSKDLTEEDKEAIRSFHLNEACKDVSLYSGQTQCILNLQLALLERIPDMTCTKIKKPIEPMDFLKRGFGCCFERARFLEKALAYYGIKTRHVALYDDTQYGLFSLFVPNIPSHAALEALTEYGWLGVSSRNSYILLNKKGFPLTFHDLSEQGLDVLLKPPPLESLYANTSYITVYGLYSRHGYFYGPNLPAPEIYYPDFLKYNFGLL